MPIEGAAFESERAKRDATPSGDSAGIAHHVVIEHGKLDLPQADKILYFGHSLARRSFMSDRVVTAAEFQTRAGQYVELAGKEPVTISKHGRPCRVLIDYDEYMRLRAYDRRRAFHAHEMDDDTAAALAMAEMSPRHGADDGLPDDA